MTFTHALAEQLLFTEVEDTETDEGMVEEMYLSMINRHPYYSVSQPGPSGLNIYGEPDLDPEVVEQEPTYTLIGSYPMQIKLDPEEEELNKYGYDRTRDAIIWMCSKILRDNSISPKVGDRIHFTFVSEVGDTVLEQLEIMDASAWDFVRQSGVPYQVTYAAMRTHKALKP